MPDPDHLPQSIAATRRTVLQIVGLAALSGGGVTVLGACASTAQPTAPTTSAPPNSAPATSAPATSPPASSSQPTEASKTPSPTARKTAAAPRGPSVSTSKVPVGGGVILKDADYVVTQPTAGRFKAFSKICTHMQCSVTSVTGGTINCPCHGSKFSIKDGSVVNPPAPTPLKEAKVTVAGGRVIVTT